MVLRWFGVGNWGDIISDFTSGPYQKFSHGVHLNISPIGGGANSKTSVIFTGIMVFKIIVKMDEFVPLLACSDNWPSKPWTNFDFQNLFRGIKNMYSFP